MQELLGTGVYFCKLEVSFPIQRNAICYSKGKEGIYMDYRIRMRNLREDSDKTQQEIATILETSQTMYARYERGANEMPIRHLIRLAQYYNVSTDYFLGLTKEKTPFPKK